jgi:L,D-transpeptidase catalytic domain/PKD domain/Putative peptidoglycan binding domain
VRRLLVLAALALPGSAAAGAPAPTIVASTLAGPAPLTVRFSAQATVVDPGPAIASYAWSFGDGTTASGPEVAHRFTKPGRYAVELTVTDALGGTTVSQTVVRAQRLRLAVTPAVVVFGKRVVLHGALVPGERGVRVVLERRAGAAWQPVKTAMTDGLGRFHAAVLPGRSADWRARIGELRSPRAALTVAPQLRIDARPGTAFLGAPIVVHARPRANDPVRVTVLRGGREVARASGALERRLVVPTPGTGRFLARVEIAGRTVTVPLRAVARTLSVGSTGLDVAALRARLAQLHVHVPAPSTTFGYELFDSVVAFQKARGLDRTGTVDAATWRALSVDTVPTPRYRGKGLHIEVSKSRQILMIVSDGQTVWYLPVSSGAGGITPVGNYRILWKALSTTTWLGPAILYRTMTFHTHYAIHGFPSVPTYPASHGCVRIPIWLADWLYEQSTVGEPVYVYE